MDCLISVELKDDLRQLPRFIERVRPLAESDSGLRIYLDTEKAKRPDMVLLGNVEGYLKEKGLYDLVFDIDIGSRVDMTSSIKDFPHIYYEGQMFIFTPKGIVITKEKQRNMPGVLLVEDTYMIPFKDMGLSERKSLRWSDRLLIQELQSLLGPQGYG